MEFPNTDFTVNDNDSAMAILVELGIVARFGGEGRSQQHLTTVTFGRHATHWIVACKFSGHPDPADNGLTVYGFLKATTPWDTVKEFVTHLCEQHGGGEVRFSPPEDPTALDTGAKA